jgi:4'-phosphopantetheinyl transferase
LFAFALRRDLGVDIEFHRTVREFEGLAKRFFSPGEQSVLLAMPNEERIRGFYRLWTVKEAFLKARGTGLSFPLNRFDVSFPTNANPVIRSRDDNNFGCWSCRELLCEPSYSAAVVAQDDNWQIRCFQWSIF